MRYIDKSTHRAQGQNVTTEYLKNHCRTAGGRFQDIRYDKRDTGTNLTFCSANGRRYRRQMVQILLDNQKNYCCYCLRKLKSLRGDNLDYRRITMEHIIPRGFTSANNITYYQTAPGLSPAELAMRDVYETAGYTQRPNVHPHNIAYNNLVASCDGTFPHDTNSNGGKPKICCNEARKELNAYPIYFDKNVSDYVDYLPNGDIQAVPGKRLERKVVELIANTHIDCPTLTEIRRMWYILRATDITDLTESCIDDDKRKHLLCRHLFTGQIDPDEAMKLSTKYEKAEYWNTLMLYDIFRNIMLEKYGA